MKDFILSLLLLAAVPLTPAYPQNVMFYSQNYATAPANTIHYTGHTCDNYILTTTSISCTVTNVSAGDLLIIGVSGGSGAASVTDSGGGTPTKIGADQPWNGSLGANLWYVANTTAGSHTLTATFGQNQNYNDIQVLEFAGASTTAPIDVYSESSGSGTSAHSGSFATTGANRMLVAWVVDSVGGTMSAGSPPAFTLHVSSTDTSAGTEYALAPTAGSYNPSASFSASASGWAMIGVALK